MPKRYKNSHKGTFGTALTITGSYGMAGAAILAARAAYRAGAGIIKAVVCDKIYPIITSAVPEAVCVPVKTTQSGGIDCSDIGIYNALNACKAILIGCGMGNSADTLNIIKKTASRGLFL